METRERIRLLEAKEGPPLVSVALFGKNVHNSINVQNVRNVPVSLETVFRSEFSRFSPFTENWKNCQIVDYLGKTEAG